MFAVRDNKEIGLNLEILILKKYRSVRQFCKYYLGLVGLDSEDPVEIRRLANRFSQILNGKKALQVHDLPVISELLGVSCEEILSCGDTRIPLSNRRTNYNIAFSNNPIDWEEYLSRDDHIAAYADEFGKTVLDYAIEFKNYKFIKYLIKRGYITLISDSPDDWAWTTNFGAESKIVERPFEHPTLKEEFYTNKLLRSQILSLAIENEDMDTLETFRAKEVPPQLRVNMYLGDLDISGYYDETFIKEIVGSSVKIFNYFLKEYMLKSQNDKYEIEWLYPFAGEIVEQCIKTKNSERALRAINKITEHNKKAYEDLRRRFLLAAKKNKDFYRTRSYQEAVSMVAHDYHISKEKNFVSLCPFRIEGVDPLAFHIIKINASSKDEEIQNKINKANDWYDKILNLPNLIIKNS